MPTRGEASVCNCHLFFHPPSFHSFHPISTASAASARLPPYTELVPAVHMPPARVSCAAGRWFTVDVEGTLRYFEDDKAAKEKGEVKLSKDCTLLDGPGCEEYEWAKQRPAWPEGKAADCRLALVTQDRTFFFTGEDAGETAALFAGLKPFCA